MGKVKKKAAKKSQVAKPKKKVATTVKLAKGGAKVTPKKPIAKSTSKNKASSKATNVQPNKTLETRKASSEPKQNKSLSKSGASAFEKKSDEKKTATRIERPVPKFLDDLPDVPVHASQAQPEHTGGRISEFRSSDLFSEEDLAHFLQLLKNERDKILEKAKQAVNAGNIVIDKDEMYDEVDLASATINQNLTFRLLDRDRKLLSEIEHAITKIQSGEFGYCEGTGEPIPKRRLELRPWTRHSVKYKEQLERMKKSGRGVVDEDEVT